MPIVIDRRDDSPEIMRLKDTETNQWVAEIPSDVALYVLQSVRSAYDLGLNNGFDRGAEEVERAILRQQETAMKDGDATRLTDLKTATRILRECFPQLTKP